MLRIHECVPQRRWESVNGKNVKWLIVVLANMRECELNEMPVMSAYNSFLFEVTRFAQGFSLLTKSDP